MNESMAVVAGVFATLFAMHMLADHWVQTHHQATTKGLPGWPGRLACARHVLTYTATSAFGLVLLALATGWRPHLAAVLAGLTVSAVTHYVADRRTPLRRLAALTGHAEFWALGAPRPGRDDNPTLGGAYAMDQSWHILWLFIAALIMAFDVAS